MAAAHSAATASSSARAPSVRFEHLTKIYSGRSDHPTVAVQDVTLSITAGSLTVLVGSSGSGKTTLLRSVNRMVAPTSGRVLIDVHDVSGLDAVKLPACPRLRA